MKDFADLTEREVLAVAISGEEEDSRIYIAGSVLTRSLFGDFQFAQPKL
jgi:hypothetical protein